MTNTKSSLQPINPRKVSLAAVVFNGGDAPPTPVVAPLEEMLGSQHRIADAAIGTHYVLFEHEPGPINVTTVRAVTGLAFVFNGMPAKQFDRLMQDLERTCAHVLFTSFGHLAKGNDDCCGTVVIPIPRPLSKVDAAEVQRALMRRLGLSEGPPSAQAVVNATVTVPSCPPERADVAVLKYHEAPFLDVSRILAELPQRGSASSDAIGEQELVQLAQWMRIKEPGVGAIRAALLALNQERFSPMPHGRIEKIVLDVGRQSISEIRKKLTSVDSVRDDVVTQLVTEFESASNPALVQSKVRWIVQGYVAEGAITLITGKPKIAGKSTFVGFMAQAIVNGEPFVGHPTTKGPIVYMTEERTTFNEMLRRVNLLGHDSFRFLRFDPTRDASFAEHVEAAVHLAKQVGSKIIVVDTLAQFVNLRGESENDAATALQSFGPIQRAAGEGLGVVVIHHEKKAGGSVGDAGRGSNAFTGAADIVVSIRRTEGPSSANVRLIENVSRFTATPPSEYVELKSNGYVPLHNDDVLVPVEGIILMNAPTSATSAMRVEELTAGTDISTKKAREVVASLVQKGKLVQLGKGTRGSPFRYATRAQEGASDSSATHIENAPNEVLQNARGGVTASGVDASPQVEKVTPNFVPSPSGDGSAKSKRKRAKKSTSGTTAAAAPVVPSGADDQLHSPPMTVESIEAE